MTIRAFPYALIAAVTLGGCDDFTLCADTDSDGICNDAEVAANTCVLHPPAPEDGNYVRGRVLCSSPDPGGNLDLPLASFPVTTSEFGSTNTDCEGYFYYPLAPGVSLDYDEVNVSFVYDNDQLGLGGGVTQLRVMDDFEAGWGGGFGHFGFNRTVDASLTALADGRSVVELQPFVLDTSECEIWRIGTEIVEDYHEVTHRPMPDGRLQFMRRAGVFGTTPYVLYDHVDLASNFLDLFPGRDQRRRVLFHETGHVIRDVLDGDNPHWDGDNVNFIYARCHIGTEIFEEPYVFHEGWATYWRQARDGGHTQMIATTTDYCANSAGPRNLTLTPGHMDWVENMVANRLLDLSNEVGSGDADFGDRILVQTLEANRGSIHSLFDFETALCAVNSCGTLNRPMPPTCPPGYTNDGLTCRGPDSHVIRHYRP